MKRREFTNAQKMQMVARAMNAAGRIVCEGCGLVLGHKKYEFDHTVPEALVVDKTRQLTIADGKLLGMECCHRNGKTAADVGRITKAKRQEAAYRGLAKPKRAWPGTDKWKKKLDGTTVRRTA